MDESQNAPQNVYQAIERTASLHPKSVALVFGERTITYHQLLDHIDKVAGHLRVFGVEYGQCVAAFAQNCPEYIYCYLAAAKIGAVFVPINFSLAATEVDYILKHSEAKFLFHDTRVADLTALALPDGLLRPISELSDLPEASRDKEAADVAPGDDLLISYTSGSTGTPKAVVLDHAAQLSAAESLKQFWSLSEHDTTVLGPPLGFLLGLSTVTTVSLLVGAKVVMLRRFHPGEVLEALTRHQATIYNGVPTMFSMMLDFAEQNNRNFDLSAMRALISSGAPMPDELRSRFARKFGKAPQNYFGMTEAYPLFGKTVPDDQQTPVGAAGRIAPGVEIRVIDEDNRPCDTGSQGELQVKAPSTIKRYHKDPAMTAAALSDGWFRTGDVGYLDDNGYIYVTGRLKDLIKRGGANVAPAEVENVLLQHPSVQGAAVIAVPDPLYSEVPVAFVQKREGRYVTQEELMAFAALKLAKFKVPAQIYFVTELPLGRTGKIDKARLLGRWKALQTA
jgi:long-chain acyl-CoA synthetase